MLTRVELVVFTRTVAFPLQNPGLNISAQMPGHGGVMLMSTGGLGHQRSSCGTGHMGTTAVTSWDKAGVECWGWRRQVGVSW